MDHLKAKGLRVATVTSGQDDIEILNGIRKGAYSLVLFTPEMLLQTRKWREMLLSDIYTQNLKALVIDEAHTVKKWYVI